VNPPRAPQKKKGNPWGIKAQLKEKKRDVYLFTKTTQRAQDMEDKERETLEKEEEERGYDIGKKSINSTKILRRRGGGGKADQSKGGGGAKSRILKSTSQNLL